MAEVKGGEKEGEEREEGCKREGEEGVGGWCPSKGIDGLITHSPNYLTQKHDFLN